MSRQQVEESASTVQDSASGNIKYYGILTFSVALFRLEITEINMDRFSTKNSALMCWVCAQGFPSIIVGNIFKTSLC